MMIVFEKMQVYLFFLLCLRPSHGYELFRHALKYTQLKIYHQNLLAFIYWKNN